MGKTDMKFSDIIKSLIGKEVILFYCVALEDTVSEEFNITGTLKEADSETMTIEYTRKNTKHIFHLNTMICIISAIEEVVTE